MTTSEPEPDDQPHVLSGTHWPLLGTVIDVRITAGDRGEAARAEEIVCVEIRRLEQLFSVYDDNSMLRRWMADPATATCAEFEDLLSNALGWQRRSRGAFNVSTRRLHQLWEHAADDGRRPHHRELRDLADDMTVAPYRFVGDRLQQIGDCTGVDLNAIAKGFIVDVAFEAAWRRCNLDSLTVSAGGDLNHRGPVPIQVGIEDPTTLLDNAPPLLTVDVHNAAIATSGSARRGVAVDGEWISHLLDPRTGQPADTSASVTVIAPNATMADVVATIVSVMEPAEGLQFVDDLNARKSVLDRAESFHQFAEGPIECWIIDPRRQVSSSATTSVEQCHGDSERHIVNPER